MKYEDASFEDWIRVLVMYLTSKCDNQDYENELCEEGALNFIKTPSQYEKYKRVMFDLKHPT